MVRKSLESYEFSDLFLEKQREEELEERKNKISERSEKMVFNEEYHTKGRLSWIVDLYLELDKLIMSLNKNIRKEYLQSYIKYSFNGLLFVYIATRKKESLRLWAKISYSKLGAVPLFVRDYEETSRRVGVIITFDNKREFLESKESMLEVTFKIIEKAFRGIADRKKRKETPLSRRLKEVEQIEKKIKAIEPVKSTEEFRPSLNMVIDNNGYIDIHSKIKKSQKELLNRILQETILR